MSEIRDSVQVDITTEGARLTAAGFGLPLILSATAAWAERTREYASLTEVLADFAVTTPEYKAAAKLFAQNPRPSTILIGRSALPPTQRFAITPTVLNSYTYRLKVNGTEVSFTSDASATAAEIIAGLKAAIDALSLGMTTSDQTTYLRALANAAGAFFALSSTDPNLRIKQDHADPGVATDLANIALERNDWYWLVTLFNSQAYAAAAAGWIESARKFYPVQVEDGNVPNTGVSGTDDLAEALQASETAKTAVIYSKATDDFADAALVGKLAPKTPGSYTAKFKPLSGVEVGSYTSTQRTNMRAKDCNFYESTGGQGSFEEGVTPSGSYLDFQVYKDYLQAKLEERAYRVLATLDKVPQNDRGIALMENEVRAQLGTDAAREALLDDWIVTAPKIGDVASADRAARILRSITFQATYVGGWHKVIIEGSLSF